MLRPRVVVVVLLLPVLLFVILQGGWWFAGLLALALGMAAFELAGIFQASGLRPAAPVMVAGVVLIVLQRQAIEFEYTPIVIAGLALIAMTWHVFDYERGAERSGTDFMITVAGTVYVGWLGAYLVSLRSLPDGAWWVLLALPVVWFADAGAYIIGKAVGRRKLAPRLSPKKTWEGYLAGIAAATLGGALLGLLWENSFASISSGIGLVSGAVLGAVLATIAPIGDLGISMMKREFSVKDTGSILPGHGGILDRTDTWLWAGVLSFYLIAFLF